MENKGDGVTICYWCTWNNHQRVGKGTGRLGNKRTSRDNSDNTVIKMGKNTEKCPGDLRRLAATQTPVRNQNTDRQTYTYPLFLYIIYVDPTNLIFFINLSLFIFWSCFLFRQRIKKRKEKKRKEKTRFGTCSNEVMQNPHPRKYRL